MIFHLIILLCISSAVTTIVAFFLYIKARMTERRDEHSGDGYQHHNAILDGKESLYRSIHFISLFIFVVLGVLILVHLSGKLNGVDQ